MEDKRIAVLIDADNISYKYAELIFKEASNYGNVKIKRIYGDWSKSELAPWRNTLLDYSILPIQQFNYTSGKNSTDMAILIDAMDILFGNSVDGFCIVTSDSDFTRLVARLRESDMYVVGMGEKKTPQPLVRACSEFKYLDVILKTDEKMKSAERNAKAKKVAATKTNKKKENEDQNAKSGKKPATKAQAVKEEAPKEDPIDIEKAALCNIVKEIFAANTETEWLEMSFLDAQIKRRKPDFDFRVFGFKKMVLFFESLEEYGIVVKKVLDESNHRNPSHRVYVGISDEM